MFQVNDLIKYNRLYDDCNCRGSESGKVFRITDINDISVTYNRLGAEYEGHTNIPIKEFNKKFEKV